MSSTHSILSKSELLTHWLGHRALTRRVIEAFPENELFKFSIGGMRTFGELAQELLSIAGPGLKAIVSGGEEPYTESSAYNTKEALLKQWDEETPIIESLYAQIPEGRFPESFNLFGQYEFPIIQNLLYFID